MHKKYPRSWWEGIPEEDLTKEYKDYDIKLNKYKTRVGTSLRFWEKKKWITKYNPYGWVQWYCDFYSGKRCPDDQRQIDRWKALAGITGRFSGWLVTLINKKNTSYDDIKISPKIRQTLQHWAYVLTKKDYDEINKRK